MFSAETPENIKSYRLWRILKRILQHVDITIVIKLRCSMKTNGFYPEGKLPFAFRPLSGKQKKYHLCVLCASSEPKRAGGELVLEKLTHL